MSHFTIEIALALHTAIIFASRGFELDADPIARGKMWLTCEANYSASAVLQPDYVPHGRLHIGKMTA